MNDTSSSKKLLQASIFVLEGSLLFVFNSVIVVAVLKFEALRRLKEFMIIAALGVADALFGIGTLAAGVYRIKILLLGQTNHPASKRECFLTIHAIFWALSVPMGVLMLLAVSFDRLLSVTFPLKYLGYGRRYAWSIILSVYSYCTVQFVVFALRALQNTKQTGTRFCNLKSSFESPDVAIWFYEMTVASLLSIVLYCAVLVVYKKRKAKVKELDSSKNASLSRQRRLTRTLGVSCVCTFAFSTLPTIFSFSSLWIPQLEHAEVSAWSGIFMNVNPICNLLIFFRKQKEIKMAIIALIKRKEMPLNVEMWKPVRKRRKPPEFEGKRETGF